MKYQSFSEFKKAKMNAFRAVFGHQGFTIEEEQLFESSLLEAAQAGIEAGKIGEKEYPKSADEDENFGKSYITSGYNSALLESEKQSNEWLTKSPNPTNINERN